MTITLHPGAWLNELGLEPRHKRSLLWLLGSVLGNSVFCRLTVFGSAFVLFLDHLGLDASRIGVILSLIPFAGLLALVCTPFVARIGYRRAYISFFAVRKAAISLLLVLPWVYSSWGARAGLLWVAGLVLAFAVCRAIGEIGGYALFQEVVPNAIRGRFGAATYAAVTVSGIPATLLAGWVLRGTPGTARYLWVIGIGVLFGAASVAALGFVRGGAPERRAADEPTAFGEMRAAARDGNFVRYLAGICCASLALSVFAFAPLFMKETVGLSPSTIVWLEAAASAGALIAASFWGRAADRRGSKPVLLAGLAAFGAAAALIGTPGAVAGAAIAFAVSIAVGAAQTGWFIGAEKYLFVRCIPPERKAGYIAVYYAVAGVANGLGPLAGGRIVEAFRGSAAPYSPLFLASAGLAVAALLLLTGLETDKGL